MPNVSEIAPLLIVDPSCEQFDYAGATAIAVVMLVVVVPVMLRDQPACSAGRSCAPGALGVDAMAAAPTSMRRRPGRSADRAAARFASCVIAMALIFLACSLSLPLVAVFAQALAKGVGAYFAALSRSRRAVRRSG